MENTDSRPKQFAVDNKAAYAGNGTPTPEEDTIDALAAEAGIAPAPGEPLAAKESLDERDDERWELDPSSAEDHS